MQDVVDVVLLKRTACENGDAKNLERARASNNPFMNSGETSYGTLGSTRSTHLTDSTMVRLRRG